MEGPFDPQHPGQDAGASQPEAPDDLHALLERLLGQGDVRPAAPGAGDDLWPDLFAAAPVADDVSTIIPPPEAPAAVAELPTDVEEPAVEARVEPAPLRAWEPVIVDAAAATTNVDDIHAAILASVSVEIAPIAAIAAEPQPDAPPSLTEMLEAALPAEAFTVDSAVDDALADLNLTFSGVDLSVSEGAVDDASRDDASLDDASLHYASLDDVSLDDVSLDDLSLDAVSLGDATDDGEPEMAVLDGPAAPAFALTPFEASETDAADAVDANPDAEALWAAAVPELGLDVAPLLDLAIIEDEGPVTPTAVVLPWRHEPKAVEPAAPTAHDLIEAALAGLHADLTSEPVEPLRTPDVAVSTAHVVFRLGSRTMAIALAAVSEIARPPKVTRLPHVPAWVLGIANLRGDIVSMLDLEGFLSGKVGKSSHEQRMLALRPAGDEVRTAVLVDSVDGIQAFEDARISRVTRGYDAEVAPYARGLYQLEDDLVVVLDADRLLQSKPMRQFEDGAGAR